MNFVDFEFLKRDERSIEPRYHNNYGDCLMKMYDYFVIDSKIFLVYELLGDELFLYLNDIIETQPVPLETVKLLTKNINSVSALLY